MRKYRQEVDRGVSPVIGVILMVAVTVLLAAVVGTFVMNMDMPENQPPSANWDITNESMHILIEHDGGEAASAEELVAVVSYTGNSQERLAFTKGSKAYSEGEELRASDSLVIDFSGSSSASEYVDASSHSPGDVETVQLIWESSTSTQTQPLTTWEH